MSQSITTPETLETKFSNKILTTTEKYVSFNDLIWALGKENINETREKYSHLITNKKLGLPRMLTSDARKILNGTYEYWNSSIITANIEEAVMINKSKYDDFPF